MELIFNGDKTRPGRRYLYAHYVTTLLRLFRLKNSGWQLMVEERTEEIEGSWPHPESGIESSPSKRKQHLNRRKKMINIKGAVGLAKCGIKLCSYCDHQLLPNRCGQGLLFIRCPINTYTDALLIAPNTKSTIPNQSYKKTPIRRSAAPLIVPSQSSWFKTLQMYDSMCTILDELI